MTAWPRGRQLKIFENLKTVSSQIADIAEIGLAMAKAYR